MMTVLIIPMSQPNIQIQPLKQGFLRAAAEPAYALVRLVAPAKPAELKAESRQPLDLAIVIDRSGSMSGRPLEAAVESTVRIINGLQSGDRIAVVAFDDSVDVISPLTEVGGRDELVRQVRAIRSGGSTALFDGWREGLNRLLPHVDKGRISRVILLSDGQANHGLTDEQEIFRQVAKAAGEGVTTSTVGLGHGFNESLLSGMAQAGEGAANYGQTADDLDEAFEEQFSILSNALLRQVRISVTGGSDVAARLVGELHGESAGRSRNLGTLAWESSLIAVVELRPGQGAKADELAAVNVEALNKEGERVCFGPSIISIPEVSLADLAILPESPEVRAAVSEALLSERIESAEELVRAGRTKEGREALQRLLNDPKLSDYARRKLEYLIQQLEEDSVYASKELRYGRNQILHKLRSVDASDIVADFSPEAENLKSLYLRKKLAAGQATRRPRDKGQA